MAGSHIASTHLSIIEGKRSPSLAPRTNMSCWFWGKITGWPGGSLGWDHRSICHVLVSAADETGRIPISQHLYTDQTPTTPSHIQTIRPHILIVSNEMWTLGQLGTIKQAIFFWMTHSNLQHFLCSTQKPSFSLYTPKLKASSQGFISGLHLKTK